MTLRSRSHYLGVKSTLRKINRQSYNVVLMKLRLVSIVLMEEPTRWSLNHISWKLIIKKQKNI